MKIVGSVMFSLMLFVVASLFVNVAIKNTTTLVAAPAVMSIAENDAQWRRDIHFRRWCDNCRHTYNRFAVSNTILSLRIINSLNHNKQTL